jgi:hypothetical protein
MPNLGVSKSLTRSVADQFWIVDQVATAGPPLPFKSNLTSIPAAELSGDGPLGAFQAGVARTPRKTVSVAVLRWISRGTGRQRGLGSAKQPATRL